MRITGFHVDGFGLLHDQAVNGVPAGTTVVLGPNEAGKSTLHAFLVRTLFGHPRANDAEGRNRHEPLRGGRHGGVVHCADEAGDWEVHRFTEGSPRLRVVAPDGSESTGTDAVLPLLGRTVDAARYEQVFAIDLDDLAGVGSLGGGALDDLLFDAATVGTGRSLRAARDEAIERRDALWTPAASKRPLALAMTRRAEARSGLAVAQDRARANLDTRRLLDEAAARVERLGTRQEEQAARITLLERVRDAWTSWSRASELRDELGALPDVTVDAAVLAAAREASAELAAAEHRREDLAADRAEVEQAIAGVQLDDDAAAACDRVEALAEGLHAHELTMEQLSPAASRLETAEAAVRTARDHLGPGWNEERIRAVPVDAPTRQHLEEVGDELLDAELRAEAADDRATEAERAAERRARTATERAAELPDAPPEQEVVEAEQALGVLRVGIPSLDRGALPPPPVPAAPPSRVPGVAALAMAAGLAAAAAVGLVPDGVPDLGLLAAVAALVGAGAFVLGRSAPASGDAPDAGRAAVGEEQAGVAEEVARAAASVGLPHRPTLTQVEQVATRVDNARRLRRERADVERHLRSLHEDAEDAARTAADLRAAADQRHAEHAAAAAAWTDACEQAGLDPDEGVRVALTRHDRIGAARRALDELVAAREAVARAQPRVEQFRDDVAAVAAELGHDVAGQEAVRLLPGLRERVRAAAAACDERDRHVAKGDELDELLAAARAAADRARTARGEALARADVADLDELEARARVAARREELAGELAAAERNVTQLLGSGPRGEEGRQLLRTADPTAWEQQLTAATEAAAALTDERDQALAERTELEAQLRRLGGDDAVPRAAQELAAAELEVADLAERWAVADTAARLLEETVARFEREQQPRVLTRASELFGRATGGHWAEVRRLDEQVVVARSPGGDPVPAGALSRGTREQLWLCLRLSLAEDLSQDRPLPLLVDDLLGTSDPERSLHVARVLADVARRQQVWLFTCHPRTADLVTSTDPTAGVLRLRRGGTVVGLSHRDVDPDEEFVLQLDV